jgi:hypothetical protein
VALVGLAVVVAAGAVVLWPRPERIAWERFDRIHYGMTRAEVESVLGPAGDYRTRSSTTRWNFSQGEAPSPQEPAIPLRKTAGKGMRSSSELGTAMAAG